MPTANMVDAETPTEAPSNIELTSEQATSNKDAKPTITIASDSETAESPAEDEASSTQGLPVGDPAIDHEEFVECADDNEEDRAEVVSQESELITSDLAVRRGLAKQCLAIAARHGMLVGGCMISLLAGSGLSYLLFGASRTPTATTALADQNTEPASKSTPSLEQYVAAIVRRNEPLKPLVPFFDLNPAMVELGRKLFHEQALSSNGRVSCASCHAVEQGGTSREALPRGVTGQVAKYNAPSILNVAQNSAYDWDGRFASLEEQLDDPITRPEELDSSWERVLKYLNSDSNYRARFKAIFDSEPTQKGVASAIAAYERSLTTVNSKFDQWLAGNEKALSGDEFGGYFLFKKYGCVNCHQGEAVGGTMFQPLGIAKKYFDDASSSTHLGRFEVTKRDKDRHVFRVPALRNVELTAPYLHDGSAETLENAIAIMLEFQCGETVNTEDVRRLAVFLKTLTGQLPSGS